MQEASPCPNHDCRRGFVVRVRREPGDVRADVRATWGCASCPTHPRPPLDDAGFSVGEAQREVFLWRQALEEALTANIDRFHAAQTLPAPAPPDFGPSASGAQADGTIPDSVSSDDAASDHRASVADPLESAFPVTVDSGDPDSGILSADATAVSAIMQELASVLLLPLELDAPTHVGWMLTILARLLLPGLNTNARTRGMPPSPLTAQRPVQVETLVGSLAP